MRTLRADLHVHSCHSLRSGNLRFLKSRDCYSRPEDVYRVAKARGMDLVTITDHDSIGGCLEYLDRHPDASDFFISEEVSCRLPQGDVEVHLGVYGMDERLHRELQPLRRDVFEVTARLREAGVFFVLNHLLHFYRRQLPLDAYLELLDEVPGARSAKRHHASRRTTRSSSRSRCDGTARLRVAMVGGSDAHTLRRVGRTWTEVPVERRQRAFPTSSPACANVAAGPAAPTEVQQVSSATPTASSPGTARACSGRARAITRRFAAPPAWRSRWFRFPPSSCRWSIVASGKRREANEVRRVREELSSWLERSTESIQTVETQA